MKHYRAGIGLLLPFIMLSLAALACSLAAATEKPRQAIWTPEPVTAAPYPTVAVVLPTAQPAPTWVMPTPYPLAPLPLATPAPTMSAGVAAALSTLAPTVDPHHVIITESDVAQALASGAAQSNGVQVQNPAVRFTGGKTIITADQVAYGLINVQNLTITGRLVARNGQLQMDTESVSPQGLVTAMIPAVINQAFKQYTSQWYVEDVQTLEGRIELTIR